VDGLDPVGTEIVVVGVAVGVPHEEEDGVTGADQDPRDVGHQEVIHVLVVVLNHHDDLDLIPEGVTKNAKEKADWTAK